MGDTDKQRNIMVVEDDGSILKLITEVLKCEGYRLFPFPEPGKAVQWIGTAPEAIDLVITDIKMPGMSGKDLADRLCQSHPGIKILFISGYSEYNWKDLNSCAKPDGYYLRKPFGPSQVIRTVKEILEARDTKA
jgi:DNA-binding NtrC family response regulator